LGGVPGFLGGVPGCWGGVPDFLVDVPGLGGARGVPVFLEVLHAAECSMFTESRSSALSLPLTSVPASAGRAKTPPLKALPVSQRIWTPPRIWTPRSRSASGFGPPGPNPLADMDPLSRIWTPLKTSVLLSKFGKIVFGAVKEAK